ncbi:sigma factor-like helix-turn-helix DNA-binding protein [Alicyclobacillus tolerans]|uniref:sigma factor-like helix-turn-helix DNA-binding protein n=1 Tax=Alicyclobacillus tolerans TaxID=90970 RepID=UPI003B81E300
MALDATVSRQSKRTWADVIPDQRNHADSTYERVFQWLDEWQRTKILKPAQAEALYLHAVEMQTYQEISSFVGCDYTTVLYHYNQAIKRLRDFYLDRLQQEYGEDWIYVLCSPCSERKVVEEI